MTLKKMLVLGVSSLSLIALNQALAQDILAEEHQPDRSVTAVTTTKEGEKPVSTEETLAPETLSDTTDEPSDVNGGDKDGVDKEEDKPASADAKKTEPTPTDSATATTTDTASKPAESDKTTEEVIDAERTSSIRPKEVKFKTNDDILDWQPDARPDDAINKASVPLAKREKGEIINPLASKDAKVQAVSLMNSKNSNHASVGGDDFKTYAFDYWQYVDSMVFWDGPVPSPDVIDAAHRNGVPIYGTLFFNWSDSQEDQDKILDFIKEDSAGSKTFPIARKIVDIAKYYGFDGYFINQETSGWGLAGKAEQMRQFMLYTKAYAKEQHYPIGISWYDAMSNSGYRNHINGVSKANDTFVKPDTNGELPSDHFFVNFNWSKSTNNETIETMKEHGRNPYDAYAGLELQKSSYKTYINRAALIGKDKKTLLSLGLYTPDSILGRSKDGADYHEQEGIFWVGEGGNPKTADDSHEWSAIARFVVDKTPITSPLFNTYFNTGHGKQWFVDGKVSKKDSWNYRSISEVLPTWRWWIEAKKSALKGKYDFDDALNGGNSIQFSGKLEENNRNDIMLYSTNFMATDKTKLKIALKGGQGANLKVAVSTAADYAKNSFKEFTLTPGQDWTASVVDLSSLANQKIFAIKLIIENKETTEDFNLHVGQLAIYENDQQPAAPASAKVKDQRLVNAQEAEAIVQVTPSEKTAYYEVYQQYGDQWQILTASSNPTIYLSKVTRPADSKGMKQTLKVIAVGQNGQRSEATTFDFDWTMETADTSLPKPRAENVVLGAVVTGSSHPTTDGSEQETSMLNGTITSNSDKWCIDAYQAHVDIKLTTVRTIKRWVVEHAGAGGESVADGKMNTRDFDLYYKDMETGEWKLAHKVRGNKDHVTDVRLDKPITAQEWRLDVVTRDNGSPWGAIRIYNWKMYEEFDDESLNIPMSHAYAKIMKDNKLQVAFTDVKKGLTVSLYKDRLGTQKVASMTTTEDGRLVMPAIDTENLGDLIYYRTKEEGKEESNILAIHFRKSKETPTPVKPDTPKNTVTAKTLVDPATHVSVRVNEEDSSTINSLRVCPISDKASLANMDYDLYDIELLDKDDQVTNIQKPALVQLPIDEGKTVSSVFYLSENGEKVSLPFTQDGQTLTFFAAHFSQYGIVYKTETTRTPAQDTPSDKTDKPETKTTPLAMKPAEKATVNLVTSEKERLPKTGSQSSLLLSLLGVFLGILAFLFKRKAD